MKRRKKRMLTKTVMVVYATSNSGIPARAAVTMPVLPWERRKRKKARKPK